MEVRATSQPSRLDKLIFSEIGQFDLFLYQALLKVHRRWGWAVSVRAEPDKNYRVLVEKIVETRKKVGITQVELAKAIQADQSQISKYERYERIIGLRDFARMCRVLKIDPRKLLDLLE